MKRKLFFKGKIYVSAKCSAIHTFSEDCAKETLQESARENNDTDDTTQDNKQKTVHENTKNNLKRTNKLQITFNKNKTTQSADVIRHLRRKTKNSHTTANINKSGEDDIDLAGQLSTSQQEDFPQSLCVEHDDSKDSRYCNTGDSSFRQTGRVLIKQILLYPTISPW